MTANLPTTANPPALPTPANPAPPTLADNPLWRRLTASGNLTDRVGWGEFGHADLPEMRAFIAQAEALLVPAPRKALVLELEKLFGHYPASNFDGAAGEARWLDWIADLGDAPLDAVQAACRDWRRSPARFAPTPGQLIEKMGEYLAARRFALAAAGRVVRIIEGALT